ncbi:MAG: hypothetical protein EZS28_041533, partial [Streblomastix strix]
ETTIQVSDFSSGEIRQILIELQVDPASATETEPEAAKNLALGVLQLRFSRTEESPIEEIEIPLSILVDDDEVRRDATNNAFAESIEKVAAEVMSAEANEAHDKAMMELEAGRAAEARNILQQQQTRQTAYQNMMPETMSSTPQYQIFDQQRTRFASSIQQVGAAEHNGQLRRNMALNSRRQGQQMAQGYFSSSNQAQMRSEEINANYGQQPPIPPPPFNQQFLPPKY